MAYFAAGDLLVTGPSPGLSGGRPCDRDAPSAAFRLGSDFWRRSVTPSSAAANYSSDTKPGERSMSRKIELFHAGSWTSSQVVRLVQTLVCPSCDVVDVDLDAEGKQDAATRDRPQPHVRVMGRTVWLENSRPGGGAIGPGDPTPEPGAPVARRPR